MTAEEVRELLGRSRTELDAARSLAEHDFSAQAIAHAYYAASFASEGALLSVGETRSKHSGVISAFGQLVVKGGGLDAAIGAALRKLFELRNDAVDNAVGVEKEMAVAAIADAERFVAAVDDWLRRCAK